MLKIAEFSHFCAGSCIKTNFIQLGKPRFPQFITLTTGLPRYLLLPIGAFMYEPRGEIKNELYITKRRSDNLIASLEKKLLV